MIPTSFMCSSVLSTTGSFFIFSWNMMFTAFSRGIAGLTTMTGSLITSLTCTFSGFIPLVTTLVRMSLSVRIPTRFPSWRTTSPLTPNLAIDLAAFFIV